MVHVVGTVHDVADNPDRVERIVVRAVEPRMHGTTYITEESAQFPVVNGVLDFDVLPGPCAVAFLRGHGATTYAKLLVPDAAEATFKECLDAADLAEGATKATLENAVRQVQQELSKVAPLVDEVRTLHTEVSNDRTAVDGFAKAAKASASAAASSQSKAKTSETNAASSAASAESQQKSAWSHFNNTVKEAEKAANSATAAKASETKAASSASSSASSASSSKTQADKSATSATQAAASRDAAKSSETAAAGSAAAAKTSETNSKQSETNAGDYAAVATTAATEAVDAMDAAALSAAAFSIYTGTGFPEGKVEAPVGSVYTDSAATNGAIRWIKTSGTGNTGWSVEYGDTGWRDIRASGDATWDFSGHIRYGIAIRRIGERVFLWMAGEYDISAGRHLFHAPEGFRHQVGKYGLTYSEVGTFSVGNNIYTIGAFANGRDYYITGKAPTSGKAIAEFTWTTDQPWPTTLPGTPA